MGNERILLVDDEVDFVKNVKKLLENRGYHVTARHSGDTALQAIQDEGGYDIMVLDLKMPGMDGMTTLKEMKKLDLHIPTLVLTGHGDIGTALEAMKLGAVDYLTKPCGIEEIEEKMMDLRKQDNGKKQSMLGKILNKK